MHDQHAHSLLKGYKNILVVNSRVCELQPTASSFSYQAGNQATKQQFKFDFIHFMISESVHWTSITLHYSPKTAVELKMMHLPPPIPLRC